LEDPAAATRRSIAALTPLNDAFATLRNATSDLAIRGIGAIRGSGLKSER
jgi:hypothetical protein